MILKTKIEEKPNLGDVREVKKFLLFPYRLGNETRWLEKAKILQECKWLETEPQEFSGYSYSYLGWEDVKFI